MRAAKLQGSAKPSTAWRFDSAGKFGENARLSSLLWQARYGMFSPKDPA
jgi:hypothetical protein